LTLQQLLLLRLQLLLLTQQLLLLQLTSHLQRAKIGRCSGTTWPKRLCAATHLRTVGGESVTFRERCNLATYCGAFS